MTSFYPFTFEPKYISKIWGGRRLSTHFNRPVPSNAQIGESWEIADGPDFSSVIADGDLKGMTLTEIRQQFPEELYGEQAEEFAHHFPLMFKYINAEDNLSLQVHPDDRVAQKYGFPGGKAEAWYTVDAMPDSSIIRGFRAGVTKAKVTKSFTKNNLLDLVSCFNVAKNDATYIAPGTVHAIGAGIIIAEIQQNCNLTYRLFDYNRIDSNGKSRMLHIDQSLNSLSFRDPGSELIHPIKINKLHYKLNICDAFSLYKYNFREPIHEYSINRMRILANIEGHGTIISPEGLFEDVEFHPGTTILIPASVHDFSLVPATHCIMLDMIPGKYYFKPTAEKTK